MLTSLLVWQRCSFAAQITKESETKDKVDAPDGRKISNPYVHKLDKVRSFNQDLGLRPMIVRLIVPMHMSVRYEPLNGSAQTIHNIIVHLAF
jgi:hypothetical protein